MDINNMILGTLAVCTIMSLGWVVYIIIDARKELRLRKEEKIELNRKIAGELLVKLNCQIENKQIDITNAAVAQQLQIIKELSTISKPKSEGSIRGKYMQVLRGDRDKYLRRTFTRMRYIGGIYADEKIDQYKYEQMVNVLRTIVNESNVNTNKSKRKLTIKKEDDANELA